MTITRDDLRAAVAAGRISEAQAVSITALAEARQGVRENLDGLDEPFELFKGFNEIFIVVGLLILYAGWFGITSLSLMLNANLSTQSMVYGIIGAAATLGLAWYFTLKRRMIAPSIFLTLAFGACALRITAALLVVVFDPSSWGWSLAAATALVFGYWVLFRVPFAMFLVGLGVFASTLIILAAKTGGITAASDVFLLSSEGPFAIVTIVLGVIGFAIAMRFDMSDPHRLTRKAQTGFWLHIIAAPAIINTIALTLFQANSTLSFAVLVLFLAFMAVVAIVIDRRSFLISGIGYVVALALTVVEGGGFGAILLLGLGLIFLGAQWERLRSALMNGLPAFAGKDRMPPWSAPG